MSGGPQPGGPGGDIGVGPSAELEGTAVGLDQFVGLVDEVQATGTNISAAIDTINKLGPSYYANMSSYEATTARAFWHTVETAFTDGDVQPDELARATTWVEATHGVSTITYAFIAGGLLATGFALWGLNHGRHTGVAPTSAPKPATPVIAITVPVPEPTTIGGQIVANIEKHIAKVKITNTGFTAQQAKAVASAIQATYKDVLTVDVNVLNHVEGLYRGLARELSDTQAELKALKLAPAPGPAPSPSPPPTDLTAIQNALTSIDKRLNHLQNEIDTIDNRLTGIDNQLTTIGTSTQQPQLTPTQLKQTLAVIGPAGTAAVGLATANSALTEANLAESQLQTLGQTQPPTTIQDLEDCCQENAGITGPIRQGGATPSSLLNLGSLLGWFFELSLIGAVVDFILGIFDLPALIAGTQLDVSVIAPIAEKAAGIAASELSWSQQQAP